MDFCQELGADHIEFIANQHMFFVATAPLAADGHLNLSPKGLDSFAVIDSRRVAYIDLGGSGIETHAHLKENGRACVMFCAFDGKPLILRLYGRGAGHQFGSSEFDALREHFPNIDAPVRGIIEIELTRVQRSCGFAVPLMDYRGDRDELVKHNKRRSQDEFIAHRIATNGQSIDGLPGLDESV
jgi:hypothetical protein